MARKLEVEIIASTLGYTKGLAKAGEQTKLFARTVDESSKHIGRSLAFATGGFVAFAGASEFLRSSIDAARDAGVSQRQLAAQMKASGDSFTQSKDRIEQAGLALEKFGFTSEDSAKALTVLERGTGNITRAISLQGTVANLARAKNIDLASAANVLAKVFGGQETALRRAVPGLAKHEHGLDLITDAEKRLAGQATASTTPAERFQATLHDTEVIIGNALLPTIDKYLGELGKWLDKMNRSGQLQRDVNSAVQTGTDVIKAITAVVKLAVAAFKDFSGAVGGTKNAVELLVGAFAVFKTAKFLNAITGVSSAVTGIGTAADTTGTKIGLLARNPAWSILALAAADVFLGKKALTTQAVNDASVVPGNPYPKGTAYYDLYAAGRAGRSGTTSVPGGGTLNLAHLTDPADRAAYAAGLTARIRAQAIGLGKNLSASAGAATGRVTGLPGTVAGRTVGQYTPEQILQMKLADHPNNIGLLQQQAAYDSKQIAFLQRLKAQGRGPGAAQSAQEIIAFKSDRTSTLATIASLRSAAVGKAKAAIRLNIPGRVSGMGTGVDPWGAVGIPGLVRGGASGYGAGFAKLQDQYATPLGLQIDLAREQATGKSTTATLKAVRAAAWKALRSGKLMGQAWIDAYDAITSVNEQLKNTAKGATDTYRQQRRRAVALAGAQGMGYQYAYAAGPTIHIEHFHSNASNPKALEEELARRANARAHVRRGAR